MSRVVCIDACAVLTCPLDLTDNTIRVAPELVRKFQLPINAHTYLVVEYEGQREEVRFAGSYSQLGVLAVERSKPQNFPRGATVCFGITCGFLTDFVCQRASECAVEVANTFGDIRGTNNVWTGFNRFNGGVQFGSALWDSAPVVAQRLLKLDAGMWVDYAAVLEEPQYGYLATVNRTAGIGATTGGKTEARTEGTLNNLAVGFTAEAWAGRNTAAPLVGSESIIYNEASNNTAAKIGHRSVFRNRPDGVSSTVGGLGTNRYNSGANAYTVESQARSSDAEYCGWSRGLVFAAGGLDQSTTSKAVGVDFSDIPEAELARIEAALRLRAGLSVEWNGDSIAYDSFKSKYNKLTTAFEMSFKDNPRLSVLADNGMLMFADLSSTTPLVTNTSGLGAGKFLPIMYNGVQYKLELRLP
jgi:hypothetical protein